MASRIEFPELSLSQTPRPRSALSWPTKEEKKVLEEVAKDIWIAGRELPRRPAAARLALERAKSSFEAIDSVHPSRSGRATDLATRFENVSTQLATVEEERLGRFEGLPAETRSAVLDLLATVATAEQRAPQLLARLLTGGDSVFVAIPWTDRRFLSPPSGTWVNDLDAIVRVVKDIADLEALKARLDAIENAIGADSLASAWRTMGIAGNNGWDVVYRQDRIEVLEKLIRKEPVRLEQTREQTTRLALGPVTRKVPIAEIELHGVSDLKRLSAPAAEEL